MTELVEMRTAAGEGIKFKRFQGVNFPNDDTDPEFGLKYTKEFKYKPGDVLVCSYPKTGFHWFGNMIWKLRSLDKPKPLDTILEFGQPDVYENMECPRIIHTPSIPTLLPNDHFRNKGKVVLVLRNPKDAIVSTYHHYKNAVSFKNKQTWNEFLNSYINGEVLFGTYFDYVQKWEQFLKDKPLDQHVEVFYYEDFKAYPRCNMARLNHYLGFNRNEQYIDEVLAATTLSALRKQDASGKRETNELVRDEKGDSVIYRKGEVGDWKNHFTVAQSEVIDKLMKESLTCGIINMKYEI